MEMEKMYNEIQQQIVDHNGSFFFIGMDGSREATRDNMLSMTDYLTSFMHFDVEYCGDTLIVTRISN